MRIASRPSCTPAILYLVHFHNNSGDDDTDAEEEEDDSVISWRTDMEDMEMRKA